MLSNIYVFIFIIIIVASAILITKSTELTEEKYRQNSESYKNISRKIYSRIIMTKYGH